MKRTHSAALLLVLAAATLAVAQEATRPSPPLTARQIIEKSQLAFHYAGNDLKANVTMELIDKGGARRTRVMTMLRRDEEEGGNQKYFIYFHRPRDVRRMTFMVWKYPRKEDDRWIFIPAVDLVKRIAADDKRSSFVGSDFTYEDISGRDVEEDTHAVLREGKLGDRDCYVVRSAPKAPVDHTRRISWIDKGNFLPLKEEYYDAQDKLFRVFRADEIRNITVGEGKHARAVPTVMKRTMRNLGTGHRTEVAFTSVAYDLGLEDRDFRERHMRRPPREWTR